MLFLSFHFKACGSQYQIQQVVLTQKNVFNLCSHLGALPPEGWRGQSGEVGPLNHNAPISTRRDLVEPAILSVLNVYMVLDPILVVSSWAQMGFPMCHKEIK